MSKTVLAIIASAVAASAVAVVVFRKVFKKVFDSAGQQIFKRVIPPACREHADAIMKVASEKNVSPFLITAIIVRESRCGTALRSGTGDFAARSPSVVPDGVPVRAAGNGKVLPADGLGWGRGLMQIDYGFHYQWVKNNDWRDPLLNIRKGVEVWKSGLKYLKRNGLAGDQLVRAATAAYNAGPARVLRAVRQGRDPDSVTTGRDYSSSVLGTVSRLTKAFSSQR